MAEWTPGPWQTEAGVFAYVTDAHGETVAVCDETRPADARLISVAPEMVELLVRLVFALNGHGIAADYDEVDAVCDEAIRILDRAGAREAAAQS